MNSRIFGNYPETAIEEMRPQATFDGTSVPHPDFWPGIAFE
jgi:hypothetical protein